MRIIEELKDVYNILQKAEYIFDDPTAKGQLYLCHHKLKQVIKTLEARELIDKKEDKKIEKFDIGLIADDELEGLIKSINLCNHEIQDKLNEIIDRLEGGDNE